MRWKPVYLILAAMLVIAGGGYYYWLETKTPALPAGFAMSNGRIEAERIDVSAKMAGRISEVLVSEGDWVKAGETVARMDSAEIDAQLRAAEAAVLQAQQQKIQAEALSRQRLSEEQYVQSEFDRTAKLAANGHATQEQVDTVRNSLTTAQAAVASAAAGIDLASATIAAANASVEQLKSVQSDMELKAPHDGRVQYILIKGGEIVAAGGTVVTLTDLTDIYMTIFLPAADAGRLSIGAQARLILDPIPEYVIPATVTFVASTAQFTPKAVETSDEREQLMFRVKLSISPELLAKYQQQAKAGVAGIGYVRVNDSAQWPETLQVKLPQ
ncbi:MAG: HlyD family efflux transporter periplasmic adaptor subunit [Thioclava sp.]|nr:HlyD family efflux transporter periplasmic adaptor subunit [Thioclava sp.]MBD3805385.1 HlyD family efflux transporter periplasmic adaptor subunit [Thioclava sp.]